MNIDTGTDRRPLLTLEEAIGVIFVAITLVLALL